MRNLLKIPADQSYIHHFFSLLFFSLFILAAEGCGEMKTGMGWCVQRSECGKAGLNCIGAVKAFSPNQNSSQDQLLAFCATRETSCRDWCHKHCYYAKGSWCYTEKYHLIPK
ncbi:MAG TPA: hypothetical protein PL048_00150 [Leptospiraceae bacterium]|nr:hypothetical protein [Leptospiraceae bacterium]HMY67343.1 hypothetical protein [Leptospiraceae bacterium]HMZ57154.1 hypothetical protein [Leptospiraceae bacterium]HNI98749.1 hypothetical protein [Leptospiraceae bacterium]